MEAGTLALLLVAQGSGVGRAGGADGVATGFFLRAVGLPLGLGFDLLLGN